MILRAIVIIAVIAAVVLYAVGRSANAYSAPQAALELSAMLGPAVDLARTTDDGATITFTAEANDQTRVALWAHRPIPGSVMESTPRSTFVAAASISVSGVSAAPAILISSGGLASATSWTPGGPTLSADGTCPTGSLQVIVTSSMSSETHTIACNAPNQLQ